jgi:tRNA A37 threonylcarbamoyladenosine dehydratase
LESTIGLPKVAVATNRIHDINPEIRVTELNLFFDEHTDIDAHPDFVIDAIDTVPSKVALYKWAHKNNIPLISSMGAASKTDLTQIKIAPISQTCVCPLAGRIRRAVRDENLPDFPVVFSTQTPHPVIGHAKNLGSIITVTGTFGLMLANYVIGEIVGEK